ncbi:uncharacterized protein [Atheta coriaria]|uniref:uncharacterized protein n=1 Tax=Dalotia coriaria TaxID=877792 RepID=UPI0031F3FDBD
MNRILFFGMCVALVAGCYCASLKKQNNTASHRKYCTDEKDIEFKLPVGEQAPSAKGTCMLVKCEDVVNGESIYTAIGCGVFVPTEGCNATNYDYSKRYPHCCPGEEC